MKTFRLFSNTQPAEKNLVNALLTVVALAALLNIGACFKTDYAPGSRDQCESCQEDVDCCCGLKCLSFYNKNGVFTRCATYQTSSCPQ